MKKPKRIIRKPSFFLWYFLGPLLLVFYYFMHVRFHINKIKVRNRSIILAPHRSYMDFITVPLATWPKRGHVVSTSYWFRSPKLGKVLMALGCVKKDQYKSDIRAIRQMVDCLDHNEIIYMFPEGQMSLDGRTALIVPGIEKFIKKFKPNVYILLTNGAYLTSPKWHKKLAHGEIDCEMKLLYPSEEIDNYSANEIYNSITKELHQSDDFLWSKAHPEHHYLAKDKAERAEMVLPYCPKCHKEGTLKSHDSKIYCDCGFEVELERTSYNFKDNPYFSDFGAFIAFEREELRKEALNHLVLEDEARIVYYSGDEATETVYNKVRMDESTISFMGGDETIVIPLNQIINFVVTLGVSFEVPTPERTYRIYPKECYRAVHYRLYLDAVKEKENK